MKQEISFGKGLMINYEQRRGKNREFRWFKLSGNEIATANLQVLAALPENTPVAIPCRTAAVYRQWRSTGDIKEEAPMKTGKQLMHKSTFRMKLVQVANYFFMFYSSFSY